VGAGGPLPDAAAVVLTSTHGSTIGHDCDTRHRLADRQRPGQRVILDADLARIYGVGTKRLNEQVKCNAKRFPPDFMFRLAREDAEECHRTRSGSTTATAWSDRSQIATGSQKHRDPRQPPLAFTEHGALMAANVLNSDGAVESAANSVRAPTPIGASGAFAPERTGANGR
jgi:hypothetical protein